MGNNLLTILGITGAFLGTAIITDMYAENAAQTIENTVTPEIKKLPITNNITPENWKTKKSFDPLYNRIAEDLKNDKPLIVTSYLGIWYSDSLENNLYWQGMGCSIRETFKRARNLSENRIERNGKRFKDTYKNYKWSELEIQNIKVEDSKRGNFLQRGIFHQEITPNQRWKNLGVIEPFDFYLVVNVYKETDEGMELATFDMIRHLKQNKAETIHLKDGKTINLKDSQIMGYIGHNVFYGQDDESMQYYIDSGYYPNITESPSKPKGVFSFSCQSAYFGFKKTTITNNVYVLDFTTSNMAPEAYNIMGLLDSISQQFNGKETAKQVNKAYKMYHKTAGPLNVNHDYKLFK
ncbi:hypothetical protein ACFL1H_03420 [Nanoarchaeota archaeon]